MSLSDDAVAMLDARERVLTNLAEALPAVWRAWRTWDLKIADGRWAHWRLADDDKSLVYGEDESAVMELTPGENVFVEKVEHVWRPAGEAFVAIVSADDADRGFLTLAFLETSRERPVIPRSAP